MFKYGAFALIWIPRFTEKELCLFEKLKNMGFGGIEISLSPSFLESPPIIGIKKELLSGKKIMYKRICQSEG